MPQGATHYSGMEWLLAVAVAVVVTALLLLAVWFSNRREARKRIERLRRTGRFKAWDELTEALELGDGTVLIDDAMVWWTPGVLTEDDTYGELADGPLDETPDFFLTDCPTDLADPASLRARFPSARVLVMPIVLGQTVAAA